MKKITIEDILQEINGKIDHLQLSDLRAESIKKMLQVEYNNIDLLSETLNLNVPMGNVIDNVGLLEDLGYGILVLNYYELSKSYPISIPDKNSEDVSIRHNNIMSMIENIIEKKQLLG